MRANQEKKCFNIKIWKTACTPGANNILYVKKKRYKKQYDIIK